MFVPVKSSFGASGIDTGDIPASLRFRSAASAYLSRTFGAPTSTKIGTLVFHIKRGKLSAEQWLIACRTTAVYALWDSANNFTFQAPAPYAFNIATNAKFRDPIGHAQLVIKVDTTQATSADRLRVYLNGVELSLSGTPTYPTQNSDFPLFISGNLVNIGRDPLGGTYLDGYLSRVCFVDGQALTPSSFGYLNTDINEWVSKSQSAIKAVVDAGGTNSFMLDFDDATSLTTLGYDKSSKGNNWTLNNFSLTAGVTYDHMLDVLGNSYATLNAVDTSLGATNSLRDGNLTCQGAAGYPNYRATIGVTSGLWYWEGTATTVYSTLYPIFGVARLDAPIPGSTNTYSLNSPADAGSVVIRNNGGIYEQDTLARTLTSYTSGDTLAFALDMDNLALYIGKISGGTITWMNSGVPTSGASKTGAASTTLTSGKPYAPVISLSSNTTPVASINFGQRPFAASSLPTGFLALCQANLPTPAIFNPRKHFDVVTRVGLAPSGSFSTSLQLADSGGLIWQKSRSVADNNYLIDTVRGISKTLYSNSTGAEGTDANYITAVANGSVTMGANDWISSQTVVAWLWKAGGAGVTNTTGSITSTVSANVEAGFSIVRAASVGSAGNITIGHGLGGVPELLIVKETSGTGGFTTWHGSVCSTTSDYLQLNTTAAKATLANTWGTTVPNSTVFGLGVGVTVSANAAVIAYAFRSIPGYSKIGSYVGNGNAEGPNVVCGFKPRWILFKNASASSDWQLHDTARSTYNQDITPLYPNLANAESPDVSYAVDVTSNGFKIRTTAAAKNGSTNTIIFYAVADVSAKFSLAR